jgi:hypothetical protein
MVLYILIFKFFLERSREDKRLNRTVDDTWTQVSNDDVQSPVRSGLEKPKLQVLRNGMDDRGEVPTLERVITLQYEIICHAFLFPIMQYLDFSVLQFNTPTKTTAQQVHHFLHSLSTMPPTALRISSRSAGRRGSQAQTNFCCAQSLGQRTTVRNVETYSIPQDWRKVLYTKDMHM